jgi:P-type conjugative transfer protein TrbJ
VSPFGKTRGTWARRALMVATVLAVLAGARAARAQFAVVDATNLVQTTSTAISTAKTVENIIQQVNLMRQTLQSLDLSSFSSLQGLLSQGQVTYQMLSNSITALGFALQDVNRDFDRLFPKDKAKWQTVSYSDYDSYYTSWNAEITASAKFADRAQSTLLLVETNNRAAANILSQSSSATGEVRQLQLINQQLGLIYARLGDLIQNTATMNRITANMAAAAAGEKLLIRDSAERRRDGYTNRGKPPRVLNQLP